MRRGEVFVLLVLSYVAVTVGFALLYGEIALFVAGGALAIFALFVNQKE